MLPPEYRPILWHDTVQVLPEPEVVSVYLITVVDFFFFCSKAEQNLVQRHTFLYSF